MNSDYTGLLLRFPKPLQVGQLLAERRPIQHAMVEKNATYGPGAQPDENVG